MAGISVNNETTLRAKSNVGFKVRGTMVTVDNNLEVEVENMLARASMAFHAN